jgi:hypothetical protein
MLKRTRMGLGGAAFWRRLGALVVIAAMGLFSAGVLWFHMPGEAALNVVFSLSALGLSAWLGWRRWRGESSAALLIAAAPCVVCAVLLASERPRQDRLWSPEMAQTVTYIRQGDAIEVRNVRNFEWSSVTESAERWENRRYDLMRLRGLDVASLYWKSPYVAHTYFSFVWNDGEALSISVEIRKEQGESYSKLGGLFRAYELAVLAGDERDFYGWRVHAPGEEIQLFRTRATPEQARRLLLELLDRANGLATKPEFYNTLTNNCSTEISQLTAALDTGEASGWQAFATGYVPDMLYGRGILDASFPLQDLRARGRILPAAKIALSQGLTGPAFSRAIRAGVPGASSP